MNKSLKIIALIAMFQGFAACESTGGGDTVVPDGNHEVVYILNSRVNRTTLTSDSEWDQLLDRFCDYTADGQTVTFYGRNQSAAASKRTSASKEATSISTTSRDEMKRWMKEMERAGKTVTVTYDEGTGTWNGTAYVNGPQAQTERTCYTGTLTLTTLPSDPTEPVWALKVNDDSTLVLLLNGHTLYGYSPLLDENNDLLAENDVVTLCGDITRDDNNTLLLHLTRINKSDIVGRWHYYMMYTFAIDVTPAGDIIVNDTPYAPESVGNSVYFEFREDGTMTYSRCPAGTTTGGVTNTGSWSLSPDGQICCEYFDGSSCWTIAGLANGVMGLYALPSYSSTGEIFYQMELHAVR